MMERYGKGVYEGVGEEKKLRGLCWVRCRISRWKEDVLSANREALPRRVEDFGETS